MTLHTGWRIKSCVRVLKLANDSAAVAEQDEGLDWDLTGDVDQEYERRWHVEERAIHDNDRGLA